MSEKIDELVVATGASFEEISKGWAEYQKMKSEGIELTEIIKQLQSSLSDSVIMALALIGAESISSNIICVLRR